MLDPLMFQAKRNRAEDREDETAISALEGRVFEIAFLKPSAHGIKMTAAPCNRFAFAF
jgi:hypothetical protein